MPNKYPLVSIIGIPSEDNFSGHVVRLRLKKNEHGQAVAGYDKLQCHNNPEYTCSYDCAALCLVEYGKGYGLACLSNYADGMPLGVLDSETTDLDVIEYLKWGSDLCEQAEKE